MHNYVNEYIHYKYIHYKRSGFALRAGRGRRCLYFRIPSYHQQGKQITSSTPICQETVSMNLPSIAEVPNTKYRATSKSMTATSKLRYRSTMVYERLIYILKIIFHFLCLSHQVKWSDTREGVGGSYFDYNHGNIAGSNIKANYEPTQYRPEYYKSEETANSEWEPDYADFEEKNDDIHTEPELFDSKPSSAVAAALVQMPQKNIETLFRLPTLSIAQHLLNVYSLVEQ